MALGDNPMGFEGMLYYGIAGSTGSTLLENCRDITVSGDKEKGNTTVRGDSTGPPVETEDVTILKVQIEFIMLNSKTDTALEALKTAESTGNAVALRAIDFAAGKGPDGDFTLSASKPWPLNGEQVVTFTATPTRGYGRAPQTYV